MGIRSKFLLTLIIFSVVPLLVYFAINKRLFENLGDEIYDIASVLLLQTTSKELQESADNYSRNLAREFFEIERHLDLYRSEINRHLTKLESLSLVENKNRKGQLLDILRFRFQKILKFREEVISLRFLTREGESYVYPTASNNNFSTIKFLEEKQAITENPSWSLVHQYNKNKDKVAYLSASLPVFSESRRVVGFAAIDIDIIHLLKTVKPSSQWTPYMQSILLDTGFSPGASFRNPFIIAVKPPARIKGDWEASNIPLDATASQAGEINALLQGMQYGQKGYVTLLYKEEMSLWSYSSSMPGLGILNILAEREPLYKIARHPGRLSRWLNLDSLLIVSGVIVIMVIIVAYRSRRMLDPFFSLAAAFSKISSGDFSTRLSFKTDDERKMVATEFNAMAVQLEDSLRMRQGLEVAHEVQENFVPQISPDISTFDIAAKIKYCEETGGDYIDVISGRDGKICAIVGDVTGHGVGAALLMATIRALIRGGYELESDLAKVLNSANAKLTHDMGESGRFVTLFIIEIDDSTHRIKWIRAGHDPAWYYCGAEKTMSLLKGPGLALGVDPDFLYTVNSKTEQFSPGDIIVIGTDGIWETHNPDGKQFGKTRLEEIVSMNSHKPSTEICDTLIDAVNLFRGNHKQEDDISVIVIKVPNDATQ